MPATRAWSPPRPSTRCASTRTPSAGPAVGPCSPPSAAYSAAAPSTPWTTVATSYGTTTPVRRWPFCGPLRGPGPDVQYNHVWNDSANPDAYTALWNVCATPAFLAKTTDGSNHPDVVAALRYRAWEL